MEKDLDFEEASALLEGFLQPLYDASAVKPVLVYNMAPLYRQLANVQEAQAQFEPSIRILKMLVEATTFRIREYVKEIDSIRRKMERGSVGRSGAIEGQKAILDIEAEISETELETACHYRDLGLLFTRAGQADKGKLLVSKACSMLAELHFKFMDSKLNKKKKKKKDCNGENGDMDVSKKINLLLAAFCPDLGVICESLGHDEVISPEAQHAHHSTLTRNSAELGLLPPDHPHYATLLYHQQYDSEVSFPAVEKDLCRLQACIKKYRSMLGVKSLGFIGLLLAAATQKRTLKMYDLSSPLLEEAGNIVSEILGDKSTHYATILLHKAIQCFAMGDYAKAESFALTALDIKTQLLGDAHVHVAMIQYDLALIYECQGRLTDAKRSVELCIKTFSAAVPDSHPNLSAAMELYQRLNTSATLNNPMTN